ncbi:MAG: 16S rRNA (guanine(527)-N(7))-methyltransferase RsmG [Planctomycetota bacterium]|nr:16S rRNA (guanine(527)-N(7))-methyltransferase RsmG [Planctomycetota bacterium]
MYESLPAPGDAMPPGEEGGEFDPLDESLIPDDLPGAPLDLEDDDLEGELEEEGGDGEEAEDGEASEGDTEAAEKPKARSKKRKGSDEDEEVEHPDTPIPSAAKMRKALDQAFSGQEDINERMLDLMTQHARLLLETNRTMNVTAILDPTEIAVKHYLDSWRVTRMVPLVARTVLDLGSGGGFPGIPVAIAEPDCSMILCESIGKKARFLEETVKKLGLKNVRVVHARAEDYLATHRVDLVLIRAVSSVRENVRVLRKVRHAMKDVVMLKGNSWGREVRAAEREAERLGFKLDTVLEHELPDEMGARAMVVYRAPGGDGL